MIIKNSVYSKMIPCFIGLLHTITRKLIIVINNQLVGVLYVTHKNTLQVYGCVVGKFNVDSHFSSTSLVEASLGLSGAPWQPAAGDGSTLEQNVVTVAVPPNL